LQEALESSVKVYSNPLDGLKTLLAKLFTKESLANSSIKGTQCNLAKGKERGALNKESLEMIYSKYLFLYHYYHNSVKNIQPLKLYFFSFCFSVIMKDVFNSSQTETDSMIRGQQKQLRKQFKA